MVDLLPEPIRHWSAYTRKPMEQVVLRTAQELMGQPRGLSFDRIMELFRTNRTKHVVVEAYHWAPRGDGILSMDTLTNGRLYFSHDPAQWVPSSVAGASLYLLTLSISNPVFFDDQPLSYELVWRRLEDRLHHLGMNPDVLLYRPSPSTGEPAQGMVFDAKQTIKHIRYLGTAEFQFDAGFRAQEVAELSPDAWPVNTPPPGISREDLAEYVRKLLYPVKATAPSRKLTG